MTTDELIGLGAVIVVVAGALLALYLVVLASFGGRRK